MNFMEIATARQSCRSFDGRRSVEEEKIDAILEAARLAPSACNGQPYRLTVCYGEVAKAVGATTMTEVKNRFAADAPVMIVVSEEAYVPRAAEGAELMQNDYRSIDIGLVTAYLTAEATVQGLGTCILGWFVDEKIRNICHLSGKVRLVIALGYANQDDALRPKTRKDASSLFQKFR